MVWVIELLMLRYCMYNYIGRYNYTHVRFLKTKRKKATTKANRMPTQDKMV